MHDSGAGYLGHKAREWLEDKGKILDSDLRELLSKEAKEDSTATKLEDVGRTLEMLVDEPDIKRNTQLGCYTYTGEN